MEEKLSDKAYNYLITKMSIDFEHLNKEILNVAPKNIKILYSFLEFLVNLKVPYSYNGIGSAHNDSNQDYINKECNEFCRNNNILEKDKEYYIIFDTLRSAFVSFKEGGLVQMYQAKEPEEWFPKVHISEYLGIAEDIDKLDDKIIIYRGTSINEYNSKKFGQSWSLNYDVALNFAYSHYRDNPYYQNTLRIVLKTNITKDIIFYYKSFQYEEEVIVNIDLIKIDDVKIIEENILGR